MTVTSFWEKRQRKLERELVHAAQRLLRHSHGTPTLKVPMDETHGQLILVSDKESIQKYVMAWSVLDSEH